MCGQAPTACRDLASQSLYWRSARGYASLAKHLASDCCVPFVCALFDGGPLQDEITRQGSQVTVLYLSRHTILAFPLWLIDMIRMWSTLSRFIDNNKINVIQTNILGSNSFLVLALAKAKGIPVVTFNFHSQRFLPVTEGRSVKNRLYRFAYRTMRGWVSDYVAVSKEIQQTMVRLFDLREDQITAIDNGVDLGRYQQMVDREDVRHRLGLAPSAKLLITVGTLRAAKGHTFLIRAASEIVRHFPAGDFLFVGDGELRQELESQTVAAALTDNIHFLGSRQDIGQLLAASDIFVLPSLWEGLSMALLEAMAAAKPIVATSVSGTSQVITHMESGILVPPSDAGALAQAIGDLLLELDAGTCAIGDSARRRVAEQYSVEKQASEYNALYQRLLQSKGGAQWSGA